MSLRRSETDSLLSSRSTPQALLPTIRQHPKVAWATVGLASVFLLGGYDSVIVTTVPSVPQFQKDFGELYDHRYIIPSMWLSLWSALPCVGNIVGALIAGWAQDRFGRRWPFAIGSVLSTVAVAIACLSPLSADIDTRRSVFLLAEVVQGVALALAQTTAQTYMSEAVPTAMRAPAMALIPTLALTGQLIGAVVVFLGSARTSRSAYVVAFHSMWPFSAVPIIVALLIPESPVHLLRQQDLIGTLCSLRKLYTKSTDCDQLFKDLQHHVSQEDREERSSYGDCFRESNRRRTLIVIFVSMVPTLFGLNLLSDGSYFLQMVGMKASHSLIMLVLGIALALVANAIGVWVSSRVGRRTLILTSVSITTVLWLAVGVVGCWSGEFVPWYVVFLSSWHDHPCLTTTGILRQASWSSSSSAASAPGRHHTPSSAKRHHCVCGPKAWECRSSRAASSGSCSAWCCPIYIIATRRTCAPNLALCTSDFVSWLLRERGGVFRK